MTLPAREPRYLEQLEADRDSFPTEEQFLHWKRHYASEVDRGEFIIQLLRTHVQGFDPVGRAVLDIGCGDAGVPIVFARRSARAVGLEPGPRNLERAAVRVADHGVRVGLVRGVAEDLSFPDGRFDLVILDNVLEHVVDRDRTLAEIRRVLVPRGLLYLVTPKPFSLQSLASDPHYHASGLVLLPRPLQKRLIERRLGAGAYQVGWIPTRRWLRRALEHHGFESLVPPRDLWVRYVRERISRPDEVRPGLKRSLAAWLDAHPGVFANPVVRWGLDVALGSNFFIARKGR